MGTNYYSVKRGTEIGESTWDLRGTDDFLHIGKSSGGWCFSLHVIPEKGIRDLPGWVPFLLSEDRFIMNEYRDVLTYEELLDIITNRKGRSEPCAWDEVMYERNYAEPGPNNLVRHSVGRGCVAHGEGTWDLVEGDFS